MKFHINVDGVISEVNCLYREEDGALLAYPKDHDCSYVIVKGSGDRDVEAILYPLHNIDNTDYKKKELKKMLYFQQNMNADIVKENFDLANEVYAQKRFINSIEQQIQTSENTMEYWKEQHSNAKKGFWFCFAMFAVTSLLLIFN